MWTRLLDALASLALLVAVFVPLERAFPARKTQPIARRELTLDGAFFFGQYLLWNLVALTLLVFADGTLRHHGPSSFQAWVASTPWWAQGLAAVLLGDMLVYWFHRACHSWEPLWRIHSVHHSSESLDFVAAHREHPIDGICTQLAANLPAFMMGVSLQSLAGFIAFRGMWAIFVHSNVRLPLGPLRWIFGAPELHHWHHAKNFRGHNYANIAPWIDLLFGTHHCPEGEETYALGLEEKLPEGYFAKLAHPFKPAIAWIFRAPAAQRQLAGSASLHEPPPHFAPSAAGATQVPANVPVAVLQVDPPLQTL